jgi:ribose transport system permease protein
MCSDCDDKEWPTVQESRIDTDDAVSAPRETEQLLGAASRPFVARLASYVVRRGALLVAFAVLVIAFSLLRPESFFTTANLTSTLGIQAAAAVLSLGVMIVLLAGEFDLSVASTMGASAALVAYLTTTGGMSPLVAIAIVILLSVIVGAVNAFFVVKVGINSFIVTLGMGTLVEGAAIGFAGSTTIGGVPGSLTDFFQTNLFGIQRAFYCVLVLAIVSYIVLQKMPLGRNLFFTGNARRAAALAGIQVTKLRVGALITSSIIGGFAGVMLIGQVGAASPAVATPYLLPAYAAAFLGATAFTPGRFNVWGTLCSVYLLAVGTVGFQLLGFNSWVTNVFNGAILILAVAFALLFSGRNGRPATRRER